MVKKLRIITYTDRTQKEIYDIVEQPIDVVFRPSGGLTSFIQGHIAVNVLNGRTVVIEPQTGEEGGYEGD